MCSRPFGSQSVWRLARVVQGTNPAAAPKSLVLTQETFHGDKCYRNDFYDKNSELPEINNQIRGNCGQKRSHSLIEPPLLGRLAKQIQLTLRIHEFCACEFPFSLKFICHSQTTVFSWPLMDICRGANIWVTWQIHTYFQLKSNKWYPAWAAALIQRSPEDGHSSRQNSELQKLLLWGQLHGVWISTRVSPSKWVNSLNLVFPFVK